MRSNDKQWRHVVCAQMISSGQTRTHLLIITVRSRIVLFDAVGVITVASEGDNSRGSAKGDAPGRVREGGTPPAQLGGMGERCELPHRGLGLRPRSQRFLRLKNSKNYTKTQRPRKRGEEA